MNTPKCLKNVKPGRFFTRRPIDAPKESQVWVRCNYDRILKKYECINWADIGRTVYLKGDTKVYTDFIF